MASDWSSCSAFQSIIDNIDCPDLAALDLQWWTGPANLATAHARPPMCQLKGGPPLCDKV
jgi:hypothetical protein